MQFKVKNGDLILLLIVVLLSVAANLPEQLLGIVDRKHLLIVLGVIVVISLFNYLNILLFLCVVTLAIGANLPTQLTESLGVSQTVMLVFLVTLVLISMINAAFKRVEKIKGKQKHDSEESRKSILAAISKGDITKLNWLLHNNMEINFTENGVSPIILASETGYADIMQLLLGHGADLNVMNADGKTPIEIAQDKGFNRTVEIMKLAKDGVKAGWTK